uniref:Uncharacterized protein n=1 Tax=Rhizophora mucronata TaxID=61149 RepID=A0A2P2J821_RHIMU
MDFDLDFELNPWTLDQVSFVSNPLSPLLFSSSDCQPCSPLWAFYEHPDDDKLPAAATAAGFQAASPLSAVATGGLRLSDYPIIFTRQCLVLVSVRLQLLCACVVFFVSTRGAYLYRPILSAIFIHVVANFELRYPLFR